MRGVMKVRAKKRVGKANISRNKWTGSKWRERRIGERKYKEEFCICL